MSVLKETRETPGRAVCSLEMDRIRPNPGQPRKEFGEMALLELASSIRQHGLLQPITVRETEGGYEIIMGERRFRACQILGCTHIDAFILPATDKESAEMALGNVERAGIIGYSLGGLFALYAASLADAPFECAASVSGVR